MVKLKYVVKLLPIYGQSQIYGQILYAQTQIHGQTKVIVIFPCMVKHAANIWSKFKKIPLHNSHGYDVSIS